MLIFQRINQTIMKKFFNHNGYFYNWQKLQKLRKDLSFFLAFGERTFVSKRSSGIFGSGLSSKQILRQRLKYEFSDFFYLLD